MQVCVVLLQCKFTDAAGSLIFSLVFIYDISKSFSIAASTVNGV